MPLMDGLRVVRSQIHGYGVVATRAFQEGETITQVDGILYRAGERTDDRCTLWLGGDLYLDLLDQMRWLNHSCEPNIWIDAGVQEDGSPWAHVIALRPIQAAEELTLDYAFDADQAERCQCGAPSCRGWIMDTGEAAATAPSRRAG